MELENYQSELRHSYVRGGPGALVSSAVWLASGITASFSSVTTGFYVLFFAGMFIFPVSKLVLKLFFRRPVESKSNPGGLIVVETVFPMIGGLFAAWLLIPHRPEFVFSVAAIAVGSHYFGFRTAYGEWTYWVFASTLCLVGIFSIILGIPPSGSVPFVVAAIETIFGFWFIFTERQTMGISPNPIEQQFDEPK